MDFFTRLIHALTQVHPLHPMIVHFPIANTGAQNNRFPAHQVTIVAGCKNRSNCCRRPVAREGGLPPSSGQALVLPEKS